LGKPDVVLSEISSDWLKDRWQASPEGNMNGAPLALPQWLAVALPMVATKLTKVVVDWETAFGDG
jgi:hypothetical protein